MRTYLLGTLVVLLLACDGITEPLCACSPPGGGTALITGTVTSAAMGAVEGAVVQVRLLKDVTCEEPDSTVTRTATTDAVGRFHHQESWSGGRKCFRVTAEPPPGSTAAASESVEVRIDFLETVTPDSIELPLRLR